MTSLAVRKNIEVKLSWEWIKSAFYTFREAPVQFVTLSLLSVLIGLLPLLGAFMSPLFTARFAFFARQIEQGEPVPFSALFSGFFTNLTLLRLSFFNFAINVILLVAQYLLEFYFKNNGLAQSISQSYLLLIFLIPLLILQIAMWISPVICLHYPDIKPSAAMGLSIKAGLYNVAPFLVYSFIICGFTLLALLPVGLGLFVWVPVLNIATYYVYKTVIH